MRRGGRPTPACGRVPRSAVPGVDTDEVFGLEPVGCRTSGDLRHWCRPGKSSIIEFVGVRDRCCHRSRARRLSGSGGSFRGSARCGEGFDETDVCELVAPGGRTCPTPEDRSVERASDREVAGPAPWAGRRALARRDAPGVRSGRTFVRCDHRLRLAPTATRRRCRSSRAGVGGGGRS